MPKRKLVTIDGRTLEGGGQLLRNSVCLSALTKIPVRITNIRGNRTGGGGLKSQHLACVQWLALASRARTVGAYRGSTELEFHPAAEESSQLSPAFSNARLSSGEEVYAAQIEIGTAGSTTLALQAILPYILFGYKPQPLPVHLTLKGGTNVSNSPSFEYVEQVLLPTLRSLGLPAITASLKRRGLNSIGCIELVVPSIAALPLSAGSLGSDTINSTSVRNSSPPQSLQATFVGPEDCHDDIRTRLPQLITKHFPDMRQSGVFPPDPMVSEAGLTITCQPAPKGFYLLLTATSTPSSPSAKSYVLAADLLGSGRLTSQRKKNADDLLTRALNKVCADLATEWASGTVVDEHMRDQIVVYRALAQGASSVAVGCDSRGQRRKASLHTQTAEWVAMTMTAAKFDEDGISHGCGFNPAL